MAALLLLSGTTAGAGPFRPRIAAQEQAARGTRAAVLVNGQPAAVLRATVGGMSPGHRAQAAAQRLLEMVANGLTPTQVTAQHATGRVWEVHGGNKTLLQVPPGEAAAHQMSPEQLARAWAGTLRTLLAEPALTLTPGRLTVPLGESRTIAVGGAARAEEITVQDDSGLTATQWDDARRLLTVRGLAAGQGRIMVHPGAADPVPVPVTVMKYAAHVLPAISVGVSGSPAAPPDIVTQAILIGLGRAVAAEDGAEIRLLAPVVQKTSISEGEQATVQIGLRITGPGLLPVQAETAVTVVNRAVAPRPAVSLFYSNNPEQVRQEQTLFTGMLRLRQPTRLDYHHQNTGNAPLAFHADLLNPSDVPAAVQVIAGIALPGTDTIQVGRRAGAAFLNALNANAGFVLDVPAHSRVPLILQRFAPDLTVSGLLQIQQISGTDETVTVQVAAGADLAALQTPAARLVQATAGPAALQAPVLEWTPGTGAPSGTAFSPYVFGAPQVTVANSYTVGGGWTFVRLGQSGTIRDATGRRTLFGDYGAGYDIRLTLRNPSAAARLVGIFFSPEAGPAAGVFQIDGGPVQEFDPQSSTVERLLTRFSLAPGETRETVLRTLALNGSYYPASLVVHAL